MANALWSGRQITPVIEEMDERIRELEAKIKRLESALGDYLMFEEPKRPKPPAPEMIFWDDDRGKARGSGSW